MSKFYRNMKNRVCFVAVYIMMFYACIIHAQSLQELLAGKIDKVVACDNSGDYLTITDAINSVAYGNTPVVIFVKNGTYYEKVEVPDGKNNITLVGEDKDSTILVYDDYSGSGKIYNGIISSAVGNEIGTSTSHTLYIDSEDFTLLNMTVKNSAGRVGQAVALNTGGERTIIAHCRIMGNQDTYYTWGYGRFYIKDTYIEGNVDFIFGRGTTLFDSCLINTNRSSCQITAASTDENWKFGYVFQNCRVRADHGISGVTMGRPWRPYAQTVFMNCHLGAHISSAGWTDWDGRSATCYYAEYNNYGPGAKPESRVAWSHQLSDIEAQHYTMASIFARDVNPSNYAADWNPHLENNDTYQIIRQNNDLIYDDTLYNNAYLTGINYDDAGIADFAPNSLNYAVTLEAGTEVVPEISVTTQAPGSTVLITPAASLPGKTTINVSAMSGFSLTYSVSFYVPTLVSEKMFTEPIKIRPNPFTNYIEFIIGNLHPDFTLILYNSAGQVALKEVYRNQIPGSPIRINTEALKKGIYCYQLITKQGSMSGTVIKN
ncbi:MAG: T9SS type A sorting domain-containing protein [Bacteroidales bacterium]|nr:T9SS type A sorting domain-containing protein [Bacteroidales bacterium]